MSFEDMKLKQIKTFVYYKPDLMAWKAVNRSDHFIGININGVAKHDLGYKHLDFGPNEIYFFNQKDDFDAVVQEPGYCYSIHFTTYEPLEAQSFCKKVNNTDEIVKKIQKIENEWLKGSAGQLAMLSHFYALAHSFWQTYRSAYAPKDQRMVAAKEYMDQHFREKNCLMAAVEGCGLTPRRFRDLFRQSFGSAPGYYLLSKKIDYAKQLLALGYLPVADVSQLAGFCDVYYFSKQFKQQIGVPPGEFKKNPLCQEATTKGAANGCRSTK